MSHSTEVFSNPSGRAVAVMDSLGQARDAKEALSQIGLDVDEIQLLDGENNADEIDSSARWFADTDDLLERYQRKLEEGNALISAPVTDQDQLKQVEKIYYTAGASTMTHFGNLVTRTVDLESVDAEQSIEDK